MIGLMKRKPERAVGLTPVNQARVELPERLAEPVVFKLQPDHIASLKKAKLGTVPHNVENECHYNVGDKMTFTHRVKIEPYSALWVKHYKPMQGGTPSHGLTTIGFQSYAWSGLPQAMAVGRYCSISTDLKFIDSFHPMTTVGTGHWTHKSNVLIGMCMKDRDLPEITHEPFSPMIGKPYPIIEHDVWIGQGVTLSPGITIGTGAVVAAGSVVTKSVLPYQIVGGNPAKQIKFRFDEKTRERLLGSEWWRYHLADIQTLPFDDPANFINSLTKRKSASLPTYDPKPLILPDAWL